MPVGRLSRRQLAPPEAFQLRCVSGAGPSAEVLGAEIATGAQRCVGIPVKPNGHHRARESLAVRSAAQQPGPSQPDCLNQSIEPVRSGLWS